jgi:hypothetical protein
MKWEWHFLSPIQSSGTLSSRQRTGNPTRFEALEKQFARNFYHSSPMSSFHTAGLSRMNFASI